MEKDKDPLTVARYLDRIGKTRRKTMKKGAGYTTWEQLGASLIREYVRYGYEPEAHKQSMDIINGFQRANTTLRKDLRMWKVCAYTGLAACVCQAVFLWWILLV